jgi:hypothetical protein
MPSATPITIDSSIETPPITATQRQRLRATKALTDQSAYSEMTPPSHPANRLFR